MSTGGGDLHIKNSLSQVNRYQQRRCNSALCSEYPTHYSRLGLNRIVELMEEFLEQRDWIV